MKVVTVEEMRWLEERSVAAGVSLDSLMEASGLAVARRIALMEDSMRGKRIIVLVGPGNNGGDGMVAARFLSDWGALVTLYMTSARRREDKLEECRSRRVRIVEGTDDLDHWALSSYLPLTDIVVDAVLGIGQALPLDNALKDLCVKLTSIKDDHPALKLIAVDVPTGVDANTGVVDDACASADLTISLGAPKVGLLRFPAAEHVGHLETVDIGMPSNIDSALSLDLAGDTPVGLLLPNRPLSSHKGTFGRLLVVAGSRNYVGAPVLACSGAYRSGAGLVTLATPNSVYKLAAAQMLESTYLPLAETPAGNVAPDGARAVRSAFSGVDAAVIGPGLGQTEPVQEFIHHALLVEPSPGIPLVLDADALNCLAMAYRWWERLSTPSVLTPHPGELSRLLRLDVSDIQDDRLTAARRAAERWGQVVVLKGAYTVVASPDERMSISPFANPALASAGTGDVLSGVIGALLAQGLAPYEAAVTGVHLHATAGEQLRYDLGDAGLIASDLLNVLPRVIKDLREGARQVAPP
jgi:NAD(P)H-hydrate epimerase